MRRRPIIGIPTQTLHAMDGIPEGLPESWVMNQRYSRVVAAAGGLPVMIPLLEDDGTLRALYDRMDGVLIPGGVDMDPSNYGETPLPTCGRLDPARDRVELQFARWAIAEGKPLFGLCRGLQIVNVALGGTLYQDIAAQRNDAIKHDYFPTAGYSRDHLAHSVTVTSGSRLDAMVGTAPLRVNSMHHQAVKDLAPGLAPTAVAPDGLIEALESTDQPFVLGVQWHPESLTERDPRMQRLVAGFVEVASR
ncbi:MAG TPA: gamma-glutamyl-gamma-aminobutyrate hydrolase family protein [Gemmatimonadales bacterium]|jgi:putative glutamine amidotransferase